MKLFKIKGVLQHYAWGGKEFIPNLIGEPIQDQPCAEYWMGAHDKAPAEILGQELKLNEFIKKNPSTALGDKVDQKFGKLPFLFKVLDVHDMLSIQVHPSKLEAEKGFKRENELGISLSAPNRNYKDDNHKPEIMVALGDFWLLHGFKSESELKFTLQNTPELAHLDGVFGEYGYQGLYQTVMEEPDADTQETLQPLIDRVLPEYREGKLKKNSPEYWAAKAYLTFCSDGVMDKGIYSIFFFNIVNVQAGEAIFQDAGVPHAYMEGQNIELMANSDNVLRGGLTPKHVDVPELLKHTVFSETIPNILKGDSQNNGTERVYKSPAPDFELSTIQIMRDQPYKYVATTVEIVILTEGNAVIFSEESRIELMKGEVVATVAGCNYEIITSDRAVLYKAKAGI